MTQAAQNLDVLLIDFDSIELNEKEKPPEITTISEKDGFFLNAEFSDDFRIRSSIYGLMKEAQKDLPENHHFMIYEAYRPLARQKKLWDMAMDHVKANYPNADKQQLRDMAETFVADPYNGIGSGHQAGCAIDIAICDKDGHPYDMGSKCQEITPLAYTASNDISAEARKNRNILVGALEKTGFVNYPAEWWHFSYGDHQWAHLVGKKHAFFGPIDI